MSELTKRTLFYKTELVDGNKEYDYLNTKFHELEGDIEDASFIVPEHMVGRLDLISMMFYDTSALWWLIAHTNDIIDPLEMYVGQELRIPAMVDYYQFFIDNSIIDDIDEVFSSRGLKFGR